MTNAYIGERIDYLLIHNKMTRKELAEKLYITPTTLSKYINGKLNISIEILREISEILNVSADYLLGLKDKKTPFVMVKVDGKNKVFKDINISEEDFLQIKSIFSHYD